MPRLAIATATLVFSACLTGCSKAPPAPSAQILVGRGSAGAPTSDQAVGLVKNDKILEALATKYHLAFNGSRQALVETLRTNLAVERVADTDVYVLTSTLKPRTLALGMLRVWIAEIEEHHSDHQVGNEAESLRKNLAEAFKTREKLESEFEKLTADGSDTTELKNKLAKSRSQIEELTQKLQTLILQNDATLPEFKLVGEEPLKYTAAEINEYATIRRQCRNLPDISFQQAD